MTATLRANRVPPNGPQNPETYLILALMTRQRQGMSIVEDASGEVVFASRRTGERFPLNLECYEELASRGWVVSEGETITITDSGLFWLSKFMKLNGMVWDED